MINPYENKPLDSIHPNDIAEKLTDLSNQERLLHFYLLPLDLKAKVFSYFDFSIQQEVIQGLGKEETAQVLNEMEPDDRTDFFIELPDEMIKDTVNLLDKKEREIALKLLGYPPDSVARLMTPNYIRVKKFWTVERVLQHIKHYGRSAETLNSIYVIDQDFKLLDDLPIGKILMAEEGTLVSDLCDYSFVSLTTKMDQEKAVGIFNDYDRSALPVITETGVLVGIVTSDDILDVVSEEYTEDIQKFGAVEALETPYLTTSIFNLYKKRAGWLVVLFLGEMLTATAMAHFEVELEKAVILAIFIPLIIASGGNSGSQAATLILRAIALREIYLKDWFVVLKKEIIMGLMLGLTLAIIGLIRVVIWQKAGLHDYGGIHWFSVALTVSFSLIFVVLWGTFTGSMIPFILQFFKKDPATSSAPLVSTLVDVAGLIIFFNTAIWLLTGKLL